MTVISHQSGPPVSPFTSFVWVMSDAAVAAARQGIPFAEARDRAAFALDAEYRAAGLPTDTTPKETPHDPQQ